MKLLQTATHDARSVDPFHRLPCKCREITVHISDAESMGCDIAECIRHQYTVTLADLYVGMFPRTP